MSTRQALKERIIALAKEGDAIAEKAMAEGRGLNANEQAEITKKFETALEVKAQIDGLDDDQKSLAKLNALGLEYGQLATGAEAQAAKGRRLSAGQKFTESEAIKNWFQSFPNGRIPETAKNISSPAIQFGGVKDIIATGGGASNAGLLVEEDRRGLIEDGSIFRRELTIRDLVTNGTTGSDTVHFVRVAGYTNNAAPVPEARGAEPYSAGAGQVQGIKPQSTMILEEDSTTVKTIAHWIPVTKRALADAAQVRSLIDAFLRYGLEEELEDQMVSGSGSGENFGGILNESGIQEVSFTDSLLLTARHAKTLVRTVGRARPTAYVLNPADNEKIDTATNGNGDFYFGAPTGNQNQTLWGLPRIESEAIPEGLGVVADWRQAILFDREQAAIQVSDSHADFFIRNLVAILAELRAAFVIIRPSAFVTFETEAA